MAYEDDIAWSFHMPLLLSFYHTSSHNSIDRTYRSERSLMPPSDSVNKILPCRLSCPVPDFVCHQYGICHMYSKVNPQDFRLPVPWFYPWEWVMLLLGAEAVLKPGSTFFWQLTTEYLSLGFILNRPSLAYEGCGYSVFRAELLVLLAYMESAAMHLTLTFISFCCIRM